MAVKHSRVVYYLPCHTTLVQDSIYGYY